MFMSYLKKGKTMADEKIRKGDPQPTKKKKAPPPEDEPDDEEEERPKKKRRRDADDEDGADIGSSPLSAVVPVGGSIWALVALYVGLLSCFVPGLWLVSLLAGVLAFVTHKQKMSYGSIAGNMRAILGIIISLVAMVFHIALLIAYISNPVMFR